MDDNRREMIDDEILLVSKALEDIIKNTEVSELTSLEKTKEIKDLVRRLETVAKELEEDTSSDPDLFGHTGFIDSTSKLIQIYEILLVAPNQKMPNERVSFKESFDRQSALFNGADVVALRQSLHATINERLYKSTDNLNFGQKMQLGMLTNQFSIMNGGEPVKLSREGIQLPPRKLH